MESPSSPFECEADARKRVCKACDRCRIKKSKVRPFLKRAKIIQITDNSSSVMERSHAVGVAMTTQYVCLEAAKGRRRGFTQKGMPIAIEPIFSVVTPGRRYVEILERQQKQLVKGIRALYDRQVEGRAWNGPQGRNGGHPPTHEILEYLGALEIVDSSDDEDRDDSSHFEEDVRRLRQSVTASEGTQSSTIENDTAPVLSKQNDLIPNQRPRDYFGRTQIGYLDDPVGSPRSSAGSLTTKTSPSTSIDSQHWSTSFWLEQNQSPWPEKGIMSTVDFTLCSDNELEDSPMPDRFDDPFLVPPWAPEEDLSGIMYQA